MTLVEQEQKNSIQYLLNRDSQDRVTISADNVARVEAMIAENSRYNSAISQRNTDSSTCHLQTLLNELSRLTHPNKTTTERAMKSINKENSTRLSDLELSELAERLCVLSSQEIMSYLEKPTTALGPSCERYYLVKYLSQKTKDNGIRKGRQNYSFATKFCHYACMNFFAGKPEADNYPIIDSVIKSVFPKYAKDIGLTSKEIKFNNYESFVDSLDKVIKNCEVSISRNGFDHLMWYANK